MRAPCLHDFTMPSANYMNNVDSAELLPRPRSLLIAATMVAASVTYLAMHMASAVVQFRAMFKDLGLTPSASAEVVFSVPGIWWVLALASIAVLVWVATQSQFTATTKRRMKTALYVTAALAAILYGFTAFAIYPTLFELSATA